MAGTDLFKGGSIYVKASMKDQDNLLQKISNEASNQIGKLADDVNSNFEQDKKNLESLRPQLEAKKRQLTQKQNEVRAEYKRLCAALDQRNENQQAKAAKEKEIKDKKAEISTLQQKINQGYKSAQFIKKTTCPSGSVFYPLVQGGTCWQCPPGYTRTALFVDGPEACISKEKKSLCEGNYSWQLQCVLSMS